jgi:hypothetical protein
VPSSCTRCTPISTRLSSLSSPSCGTRVSFDHHNRIVCDHNDAFLGRTEKPENILDGNCCVQRNSSYLSGLVLCDLVLGVLFAVLALAVGASGLGYVDLLRVLSASIRSRFLHLSRAGCLAKSRHPWSITNLGQNTRQYHLDNLSFVRIMSFRGVFNSRFLFVVCRNGRYRDWGRFVGIQSSISHHRFHPDQQKKISTYHFDYYAVVEESLVVLMSWFNFPNFEVEN